MAALKSKAKYDLVESRKDFIVSHEDESILGSCLDPCGVCVTKGQMQDGTLCNRLIFCLLAVVMLWASSFTTAVYIANSSISSPDFEAVVESCDAAYSLSATQKADYVRCVDTQLQQCDKDFATVLNQQVKATNEALNANAAVLSGATFAQEHCSASFTTAQAAMSEWVTTGVDYNLYYTCGVSEDGGAPSSSPYCNATCGYADEALLKANLEGGGDGRGFEKCSCSEVATMVGDVGSLRAASFGLSTTYTESSTSTIHSMADYLAARSAYDKAYAYNKTEPLRKAFTEALSELQNEFSPMNFTFADIGFELDATLLACVSMRDATNYTACSMEGLTSLRELYSETRESLESQIAAAQAGVAAFADSASDLADKVASALSFFTSFWQGVDDLGIYVADDTIAFPNIALESVMVATPNWPTANVFGNVPSASWIYRDASGAVDAFANALAEASANTAALGDAFGEALTSLVGAYPGFSNEDYNPPQYGDYRPAESGATSESATADEADAESETFLASQASALNAFAELKAYTGKDSGELPAYNVSLGSSDDDLNFISQNFKFEPLIPGQLDVDLLTIAVGRLVNLLLMVDVGYRLFKTCYYIRKFWSRAGLYVPPVDVRQDRAQFKLPGSSSSSSDSSGGGGGGDSSGGGGGCCVNCLLAPCWGALFCVALAGFVMFNLALLYIPVVQEYSLVCVQGQGNNTFLTGNLNSMAYNYAAEAGNEDLVDGLEAYAVRSADYCGAYKTFTEEQQADDELTLADLKASQSRMRDDLYLMNGCINTTLMDGLFERACCDVDGGSSSGYGSCSELSDSGGSSAVGASVYMGAMNMTCPRDSSGVPYRRLSSMIDASGTQGGSASAQACTTDPADWVLEDARFDCSTLPTCDVTCDGPNGPLLEAATEQCGCSAEWLLHTWWAQVAGACVVYVVLNFSRVTIMSAVCRLCWRWMSPNCFTYRATMTFDGHYLGAPWSGKYPTFKKLLSTELRLTMARYERKAWLMLIAGIGVNYAWISYFLYFSDSNLYYDPNKN